MSSHAFFAPSSAPRVVLCPASLLLTYGMPDTQTEYAAQGTAAHWIADLTLRGGHLVERYAGCAVAVTRTGACRFVNELHPVIEDELAFEVDDEMVIAVQEYVDWCNDAEGEHYPECRVDVSRWCPRDTEGNVLSVFVPAEAFESQKGTSDHAACRPGHLVITDLKYGQGVRVLAKDNYQAVLYALGFIAEWDWMYDFQDIEIRICQPRLEHKDVWVVTRAEIEAIGAYILERFTLAMTDHAPFAPSEKACKFCKASGLCRAQKEHLSTIRALNFDNLDFIDERLLTPDELVEAWREHGFYQARFDAIARELMRAIDAGQTVKGLKLAEGRSNRKWINESLAMADLELLADLPRDKLYKSSAISPARAEALLPKAQRGIVNTLAYKPRGGAVIVDADDKRPEYAAVLAAQLEDAFPDVEDGDP